MKIIAFAGSNSSKSINHQLINYVASFVDKVDIIRLTDYQIPMYNIDVEEKDGIPAGVKALGEKLATADYLFISVAEHNGNITAFFKNILDWLSRNERTFLANKKVVLLGTSPGKGGAATAIQIAAKTLPYFGADVIKMISLASFYDKLVDGKFESLAFKEEIEGIKLV